MFAKRTGGIICGSKAEEDTVKNTVTDNVR
jgi:hypothetical protein